MRARMWTAVLVLSIIASTSVADAASRREVVRRLEDFRQFFIDFQRAPDRAVPGDLLAQCHGVIIMRHYKAGFVFGLRGGDGVVMLHDPGTRQWSAPAFVTSGEGSFGLQIGGQAIDAIILIMNRDGVDMLLKTRFQIGVDASAAAGPVGRDASAKVGPGTALLAYSRAKGLYAGVAFEGGAMLNYDKYNRAMYGRSVGLRDILLDRMVPFPQDAMTMVETLNSYMSARPLPPSRRSPPPYAVEHPASIEVYPLDEYPVDQEIEIYRAPPGAAPSPQPVSTPPPAADREAAAQAAAAARSAADAAERAAQAAEDAARAAGAY